MLLSLYVENIALIKKLNIETAPGFTVLTGETGGGKSIIVDSLTLLCGGRGDKSLIRTGEDYAVAEGVFSAEENILSEDSDYADGDGIITVYRKITSDGRSVCKLGGRTVSVSKMKEVTEKLLNIHGQQDTQSLSDESTHISLLDSYACDKAEADAYSAEYAVYRGLLDEVERLKKISEEKMLRLDVLDFQLNEIESAKIRVGEEAELENEKCVLANYEKIYENAKTAIEKLGGRDSALSSLSKAKDALNKIENYLSECPDYIKRLESCFYEIQDISESLKANIDVDCASPDKRIDEIEERLVTLSRLMHKYRTDEAGLVLKAEELKKEKKELDLSDELLTDKKNELELCEKRLSLCAAALTAKRKEAAKKLETEIKKHLASLDMPSVTFVTEFSSVPFTENGADSAVFLISANKGESPRSIAKIASGGELSRIMLSVKSAFASADGVKTVVFDEIDTGISGKTSEKLGIKLKELTKMGIQILCITHSAQIASLADTHLKVSKAEDNGRTYTSVRILSVEERIDEIARIMGGITVTDAVREASKEAVMKNLADKTG